MIKEIKEAVDRMIHKMDHSGTDVYDGDVWEREYPGLEFDDVVDHPDIDDLRIEYGEQVDEELRKLFDEGWVEFQLADARIEEMEDRMKREDPYRYYGVHKRDFRERG